MHLLRLSLLSALSATAAHAETYQWTGGVPTSASASFSEPANWTGNLMPAAGKSTRLVFGAVSGSSRVNPNQNLGSNFILNEFSITAAAPAFQFNGQSLLLAATGEGALPSIVSDSPQSQYFNLPLGFNTVTQMRGTGTGELRFAAPWQNSGRVEILHRNVRLDADSSSYEGTITLGTAATPVAPGAGSTLRLGHERALGTGRFDVFPYHTIHNAAGVPLTFGNTVYFERYQNGTSGPVTFSGAQAMTFSGHTVVSDGNALHVSNPQLQLTGSYLFGAGVAKSGTGDLVLAGKAALPGTPTTLTVLDVRVILASWDAVNERQAIFLNGYTELATNAVGGSFTVLGALRGEASSRVTISERAMGLMRTASHHADSTFHGRFQLPAALGAEGGQLVVAGNVDSLTTFTNNETVTLGSGGNLRNAPASQVSRLVVQGTQLELAPGANFRTQLPLNLAERYPDFTFIVGMNGRLRLGAGVWLNTTNDAAIEPGGEVIVRGSQSLWQHEADNTTGAQSRLLVGSEEAAPNDPAAVLVIDQGGRVETETMVMDQTSVEAVSGHVKLASGGSLGVSGALDSRAAGQQIDVDAATLEVGEMAYAGKVAAGNGGTATFSRSNSSVADLRAVFTDLPQQTTPGTIFLQSSFNLAVESSFTGTVRPLQPVTISNAAALRAATVELTRANSMNDVISMSADGLELGALSGSGLLNGFLVRGGDLTLGAGHRDASFQGVLNLSGRVHKVGTGRQSFAMGVSLSDGFEVQGGTLVLTGANFASNLVLASGPSSAAPFVIGQSATSARLEIRDGHQAGGYSRQRTNPGLVSGVNGTGALITRDAATGAASQWLCESGLKVGQVLDRARAAWRLGSVTVENRSVVFVTGLLHIGAQGGTGELIARNGGFVTADQLHLSGPPAEGHSASATVHLTGAPTRLTCKNLEFGPGGDSTSTSSLTVADGAELIVNESAHFRSGTGTLRVDRGHAVIHGFQQEPGCQLTVDLTDPVPSAGASPRPALVVDVEGEGAFVGQLTGSGSVRKQGTNEFYLGGQLMHTGGTEVSEGTLVLIEDLVFSSPILVSGGMLAPLGARVGRAGGLVSIGPGGRWAGPAIVSGTWRNEGLVTLGAQETLTLNAPAENAPGGVIRVTGGGLLKPAASFINRGVIDVITGRFEPPQGFINEGIILDASSVRISAINRTGSSVQISIPSHVGHTYHLQKSPALSGAVFTDIGSAQTGANGVTLTFTDPAATSARAYYRIRVE